MNPYYESNNCTGQAYTPLSNQLVIIRGGANFYKAKGTAPVNIPAGSYGFPGQCNIFIQQVDNVIAVEEVTLPAHRGSEWVKKDRHPHINI